ncbi:UNVERIFIED_CONTAM: hypothetical protein Sradi_6113100 [Sesamum radiatum]|uniref:Reverse transcriptase zinc-binding domain-containing protein n=1 Tax=Sesamum radiatum TaxID=300843 RepID=A0AAW2KKI3_SESRA
MGRSPALLCWPGSTYQICFDLLEVYWAMAFILPKGIIKEMIKRLRTFLWKGTSASGYPKVAWEAVCRPIEEGSTRDCSIWTVKENKGAWGWRKMLSLRHSLMSHIHYRVGNGNSVSLWHDPWHRLDLSFLVSPGTSVDQYWTSDKLSAYELFHPPGPKVFWSSLLMGFPSKSQRTALSFGSLSWGDCLHWINHGFTILGTCILCQDGVPETHDHLFFSCSFSRRCFAIIRQQIPLPWPHRDWQHGVQWASSRWRGKHVVNAAYRSLLASIVYHIWQERNARRFQQRSRPPSIVGRLVVEEIRQRIISVPYDILFAHLVFIDYGKSLGLSRGFHLTFCTV